MDIPPMEPVNIISGSVEVLYEPCRELPLPPPPEDVQDRTRDPFVVKTCPLPPSDEGQVYATPPKVVDAETVRLPIT